LSTSLARDLYRQPFGNKLRGAGIGQHPFWQARFYDFNVFTESKRTEKLDYMHFNPVKRGLVENIEQWPRSS
jgi:REP element-mobilizing transposase RayT